MEVLNNKRNSKSILFLCQFFYPEFVSSATLPYNAAEKLAEVGYKVSALCGYPKEFTEEKEYPLEEEVNSIQIKRLKYFSPKRSNFFGRIFNYFSLTSKVLLNIEYFKNFDSVIMYTNPPTLVVAGIIAKKIFGLKLVFVAFDLYPEIAIETNTISSHGFIAKLMRRINKSLYKNLDNLIVLSNDMKEYVLRNRDIKEDKIKVIPNWFEPPENKAIIKPSLFSKKKDDFIVSYFGNLGICQDHMTLFDSILSLKNHPNIKFIFAGKGNKYNLLQKFKEEHDIQNLFIFDFLYGDEYKYFMEISDAFLVSLEESVSGMAVPSKTYSYMAYGKTIIPIMSDQTDIFGEMDEISGMGVKNGDNKNLTEKIIFLKLYPEKNKEFGRKIKDLFFQKYTKDINTDKFVECFDNLFFSSDS